MKLFNVVSSIFLLITTAVAQNVVIGSPANGTSVTAGCNLTVEIDRPRTLSGSIDVSVVIGLQSCPTFPCAPPDGILGNILFYGPYTPNLNGSPPSQNFTVTIPAQMPKGRAQLGVAHLALIGAGLGPFLETLNITLDII
ncbi:hypothetical protein L208DRAFT_1373683 [Tricholoma matsutake]|nr:hypothetical protein L208DRAFT_1373683 [Tricholoma matsutake 945]